MSSIAWILSKLRFPLPVALGGTGGNTQALARDGLALKTAAIADVLGTMTSGALMEFTTSAAGDTWRFQNGLQICRLAFTGYTAGNIVVKAWPTPFAVSQPTCLFSIIPASGYDATGQSFANSGAALTAVNFASQLTMPENSVYLLGIGRWK